jgi:tRNA (guanine37-N1)-methyltransferase
LAIELSKEKSISLICGHFEGVDERILKTRNIEELSVGDFILSGGETASFVVLDSILRLLTWSFRKRTFKERREF